MNGFNTEIKYKGKPVHVQTQDMGPQAQYIESLVYKTGKLVYSQKSYYTQFMEEPDLKEKIARLMEENHYSILNDIYDGKLDRYLLIKKP